MMGGKIKVCIVSTQKEKKIELSKWQHSHRALILLGQLNRIEVIAAVKRSLTMTMQWDLRRGQCVEKNYVNFCQFYPTDCCL